MILDEGEFAVYSLAECDKITLEVQLMPGYKGKLLLEAGVQKGQSVEYNEKTEIEVGDMDSVVRTEFTGSNLSKIRICATSGNICLKKLVFR